MCTGDVLGMACNHLSMKHAPIASTRKQGLFGPSWKELFRRLLHLPSTDRLSFEKTECPLFNYVAQEESCGESSSH